MSCCCTRVYNLCDLVVCDEGDLVLAGMIPADGEYILELGFLGHVLRKTATLSTRPTSTSSSPTRAACWARPASA
jgi:hypothetical protein